MEQTTHEKLIERWAQELDLSEQQHALLSAMTVKIQPCELARPFIERDLAQGASIVAISIKYGISRHIVSRIRCECGYCE